MMEKKHFTREEIIEFQRQKINTIETDRFRKSVKLGHLLKTVIPKRKEKR